MNALKLADELENGLTNYTCIHNQEAATMLRSQSETIASLQESNRQQQAEIEFLKLQAEEAVKMLAKEIKNRSK